MASDSSLPSSFPPAPGHLDRALRVVEYLRIHCAWDRKQTARSLVPHLLEEAHETAEAVGSGDPERLRDELGDLLLNLAFQVVVGEEAGAFTREEVVAGLEAKMVRRHPHVFAPPPSERSASGPVAGNQDPGATPDPAAPASGAGATPDPLTHRAQWEALKAREREVLAPGETPASVLDSLPRGVEPLLRAHRMQEKAAGVGFDWDAPEGALAKVREEVEEVDRALREGDTPTLAEEVGDLLFSVVNLARLAGIHATPALGQANAKFEARFRAVESLARERGLAMPGASLEALDPLWDEVKAGEGEEAG
jgi:nucleoside triphosphate diphosphatase